MLILEKEPSQFSIQCNKDKFCMINSNPISLEVVSCPSVQAINGAGKSFDAIIYDTEIDDTPLQTFNNINNKFSSTPIIVLSSIKETDSTIDMLQNGAYDYIIKGFKNYSQVLYCVTGAVKQHDELEKLKAISKSFL